MLELFFDKLVRVKVNCCCFRSEILKEGEGNFFVLESFRVEFWDL